MNLRRWLPVGWYMKLAWERRARQNAMHFVADFRSGWDNTDAFFQSGKHDVDKFIADAKWGDTSQARLLEIGCGMGRMTKFLIPWFRHVDAIDISPTMIWKAKNLHSPKDNVAFHVGNGVDLHEFPDKTFDFVLSYIVFQHIPDAQVILGYIAEALRVLKPTGRFRFQARTDNAHAEPDTYDGASIRREDVERVVHKAGFKLERVTGEGTQYTYFEIGPGAI